jgi:hypothetical protein
LKVFSEVPNAAGGGTATLTTKLNDNYEEQIVGKEISTLFIRRVHENAHWEDIAPEIHQTIGFPPLRKLRVGISEKA